MKDISIVLGTYNRKKFLKLTIDSIRKEMVDSDLRHEIIVIDGGSNDGSLNWLIKQKDIITIIQHNRGRWRGKEINRRSWGYFMNLGFKIAQGKYICMVSDDCLLVPCSIKNGYNLFEEKLKENKKIGAIAFYWRDWPAEKEYRVGKTFGDNLFVNHGFYLNTALKEVDYVDENTYNFYHADGDLCLKLICNGYSCIPSPNSYIEHYSHANIKVRNSNNVKQRDDWNNYVEKWRYIFDTNSGGWITKDFCDNHNTAKKFNKFKIYSQLANFIREIPIFLKKVIKNFYRILLSFVFKRDRKQK
jgi:glycosyltransferase involved in cell wall biosynthesis